MSVCRKLSCFGVYKEVFGICIAIHFGTHENMLPFTSWFNTLCTVLNILGVDTMCISYLTLIACDIPIFCCNNSINFGFCCWPQTEIEEFFNGFQFVLAFALFVQQLFRRFFFKYLCISIPLCLQLFASFGCKWNRSENRLSLLLFLSDKHTIYVYKSPAVL